MNMFMNIPTFDALPVLKDYSGLVPGHKVYSRKYGVGVVVGRNDIDDIIVHFVCGDREVSAAHGDISLIPEKHLVKQPENIRVTHDGENLSLKAFKSGMKRERVLEKQRKRLKKDLGDSPAVRVKWRIDG